MAYVGLACWVGVGAYVLWANPVPREAHPKASGIRKQACSFLP